MRTDGRASCTASTVLLWGHPTGRASDHLQPVSPQSVTLGPGSCAAQPTQPMSRRNPRSAWPSVLGVKFVRHHELGQVCVPSAQRGPVVRKRKDCDGGCRVLFHTRPSASASASPGCSLPAPGSALASPDHARRSATYRPPRSLACQVQRLRTGRPVDAVLKNGLR